MFSGILTAATCPALNAPSSEEGAAKLAMGRSGASIGAPGAMLNATCRLVVRQRSQWAMDPWILDPQTAGETQNFLESTPLSFLRAGPPKFRRISAESRAHPNFDKKIRETWTQANLVRKLSLIHI